MSTNNQDQLNSIGKPNNNSGSNARKTVNMNDELFGVSLLNQKKLTNASDIPATDHGGATRAAFEFRKEDVALPSVSQTRSAVHALGGMNMNATQRDNSLPVNKVGNVNGHQIKSGAAAAVKVVKNEI